MATIKSLTVHCASKGVMEFTTREWEDKPKGKDVFARVTRSVISPGTEMSRILDTHTKKAGYPCGTGYLAEGVIEAVGPEVTKVKAGDYVKLPYAHMAHLNTSEDNCLLITEKVRPGTAAFAGLLSFPLRGVRNVHVKMGDTVLVFGLGPIGLFAAMWAKVNGAATVIGADPIPYRRGLAQKLGADMTVDPLKEDLPAAVKKEAPRGADVVIDATGTTRVIADTFKYAAEFGRIGVLGGIHGQVTVDLYSDFQKRNLTMVGCGSNRPEDHPYHEADADVRAILKMMERGMIDPYPALTDAPVADAITGYNHLINRDADVITYCFDWKDQAAVMKKHGLG